MMITYKMNTKESNIIITQDKFYFKKQYDENLE